MVQVPHECVYLGWEVPGETWTFLLSFFPFLLISFGDYTPPNLDHLFTMSQASGQVAHLVEPREIPWSPSPYPWVLGMNGSTLLPDPKNLMIFPHVQYLYKGDDHHLSPIWP